MQERGSEIREIEEMEETERAYLCIEQTARAATRGSCTDFLSLFNAQCKTHNRSGKRASVKKQSCKQIIVDTETQSYMP